MISRTEDYFKCYECGNDLGIPSYAVDRVRWESDLYDNVIIDASDFVRFFICQEDYRGIEDKLMTSDDVIRKDPENELIFIINKVDFRPDQFRLLYYNVLPVPIDPTKAKYLTENDMKFLLPQSMDIISTDFDI